MCLGKVALSHARAFLDIFLHADKNGAVSESSGEVFTRLGRRAFRTQGAECREREMHHHEQASASDGFIEIRALYIDNALSRGNDPSDPDRR